MRKRMLIVAVLISLILTVPVRAESVDMADQYALQYLQAVEAGQSEFTATLPTVEFDALLQQVFSRYPVLFFYYDGYYGTTWTSSSSITMKLRSVDTPWQSVYIVDSDETLKAVVGIGLAQLRQQIPFVTVGGCSVADGQISDLADEIMAESYLAYMGYAGNVYSFGSWDEPSLKRYELTLRYWEGVALSELAKWRNETEQAAIRLASTLFAQDMPDYQKELLIHDWLVENNRYNTIDVDAPASHMAYSALVTGDPVCQGYGEAMLLLAQAAGIPCMYVSGTGSTGGVTESHGWNCVELAGQWYMVDVTWDDPAASDGSDILVYDYFNVTTSQLAKDHTWDRSAYPDCTATALNADRVRQLCESGTTVYTDYSADRLVTQAEAEAQYQQMLEKAVPVVPTQPAQTEPGGTTATSPSQPASNPPAAAQPQGGGSGWVWIIIAVVVLAGGGTGVFLYIRKQKEDQRRRRQRVFDPTDPFGDGYGY